jgi:hypothetical protein
MKVTLVINLHRVDELVFMKIGQNRYLSAPGRRESPKGGNIQECGAQDTVITLVRFVQSVCKVRGCKPHTPFPLSGRKRHEVIVERDVFLQPGKKGFVRSAMVGLKHKYIKFFIFERSMHSSGLCYYSQYLMLLHYVQ